MTLKEMSSALTWARTGIEPPYNVSRWSQLLGIPRTTYNDYEKGEVSTPHKVFKRIAEVRGLTSDWHKNPPGNRARVTDDRKPIQDSVVTIPRIEVDCIGFLTEGSLHDEAMIKIYGTVTIPANFWGPGHIVTLADMEDSGDLVPHRAKIIFDKTQRGQIGQKVAVKIIQTGKDSLREIAWEDGKVVYKGLNGQRPLARHEVEEEALLVGKILIDTEDEFDGKYRRKGL